MRQGSDIKDLAEEITRIAQSKRDVVADTRQLQFGADEAGAVLVIDDAGGDGGIGHFGLRSLAHEQIGDRVGIPRRYYRRLQDEAPALLATNVNHWFTNKPERRLVRTLDGQVRAFLSDRYLRLDNYDVAQRLLPVIQQAGAQVASCALTDSRMYIKATLPGLRREVRVGDIVCAGVMISNSEVGLGALQIYPLTERLVCSNGMVHTAWGGTRRHIGRRITDDDVQQVLSAEALAADDHAYWLAARDMVQAAFNELQFHQIVEHMQAAADSPRIALPLKGVEVLANKLDLEDHEAEGVLGHLVNGGDLSAWGAANAVTRYAQDVADYDRCTELEAMGDRVLAMASDGSWAAVAGAR